jgi:uncharacterized membrane protein SpoIIM required for sporulation
MNPPSIPVILIIAVLGIYLLWKLMSPQKRKPVQPRFNIRKHRKTKTVDDMEEIE